MLGVEKACRPEWNEGGAGALVGGTVGVKVRVGGEEWLTELERVIGDVILVAKGRAGKLGLFWIGVWTALTKLFSLPPPYSSY